MTRGSGPATVQFGIQVPQHAMVEPVPSTAAPSAADVRDAMDRPEGYPAISQAVVPGDRVVIACSAAVPFLTELTADVAGYLLASGVDANDITVCVAGHCVIDEEAFHRQVGKGLADAGEQSRIRLTRCEKASGSDEITAEDFGYLAADDDANPIYVRRELLDADFIIPIVACGDVFERQTAAVGGIVPYFVDAATRRRWDLRHLPDSSAAAGEMIEEVPWLIGLQAVMLMLDGSTEGRDLLVTAVDRVGQLEVGRGRKGVEETGTDAEAVDLVIAETATGPHRLTWEGVAVTLRRAAERLPRRGRILLICEELPFHADDGGVIENSRGYGEVVDALREHATDDSLALAGIAAVSEKHSVFVYRSKPQADDPAWWEYVDSVADCEQLVRTSHNPLVMAAVRAR